MSSRGRRVGEFVRSADPAADQRQGRPLDCTSPPSHPIMRRPGADLEEKPEPRVALLAEAQNGDGMKQSGRGLTRAAIEKPTFVAGTPEPQPGRLCMRRI